jgi:hypothetical protein
VRFKSGLRAAVERRLVQFLEAGPDDAVLDVAAVRDAERLLELSHERRRDGSLVVDGDAVMMAAWLFWCRGIALGEDVGGSEFDRAAELFGMAGPSSGDPVPAPAWDLRKALWREETRAVPTMLAQAEATGDIALVEAVIRRLRRVLEPMPESRETASAWLHNLSLAYNLRHGWLGNLDDIDRAVEAERSAIALTGSAISAEQLVVLSAVLQARFVVTGRTADLDESVEASRRALAAAGKKAGGLHWDARTTALLLRYERLGEDSDLADAVAAASTALSMPAENDSYRAMRESYLSRALRSQHWRFRQPGDLDRSIELARAAVRHIPDVNPGRRLLLSNLAAVLRDRFGQTGKLADLDEAINAMTTVVRRGAGVDERDPELPRYLANIGVLYRVRFETAGDEADIESALSYARAAVRIAPPGLHDRLGFMANLSMALRQRYLWSGERADLDEATRIVGDVVAAAPKDDPELANYRHTFSRMLHSQYVRSGELDDLDAALAAGREAVEATPLEHAARGVYLSALSLVMRDRYGLTQRAADLDSAIELALAALDARPAGHPERPDYLANAGLFVATRATSNDSPADRDRAIELLREAFAERQPDDGSRPQNLSDLARVLLERHHNTGNRRDLDEALTIASEAVADASTGGPARVSCLRYLGEAHAARYKVSSNPADADKAAAAFDEAARVPEATPEDLANSALAAGRWAAECERWPDAARYFAEAVALLPKVVGRGISRRSQEHGIGHWTGIPLGAAALSVAAGQPEQAVELLEAGRGLLLVRGMETRASVDAVRDQVPQLADRLESIAASMRAGEPVVEGEKPPQWRHRRDLGEEWERAVAEARALPGLADFLAAPNANRLKATASAGPIVVVNVSVRRCDALVVTPDGIRPVALDTTAAAVAERATAFLRAVLDPTGQQTDTIVLDTLRWLWRVVARPVLAELDLLEPRGTTDLPRLWWCPTGPMSFLPLHAAQDDQDGVLDRVLSSYTPTIRALHHAAVTDPPPSTPDVLVVAQPSHGLTWAAEEASIIGDSFGQSTALIDAKATRTATIEALSSATIAHFACHGILDVAAPSESGIRLHDGTMTVLDVNRLHLRHAELAYLSACSTAVAGSELADEAIHLTSAMQLAGFRQVIGTLWPVPDLVAVQVAEDVYGRLASTGGRLDGAAALHHAVRGLRESYPDRPFLWASYLHIGP